MPRVFTVEFEAQTLTNANGDYDLVELDAATDQPIELVEVRLGQSSDFGDAQEEQLRLRIIRGHTTSGNGTATTPRPVSPMDAAADFTAETVASTIASAGTAVNLDSDTYNVRQGYTWGPRPQGMGLWTFGGELLVVRLMAAVLDDLVTSGTFTVIEYP